VNRLHRFATAALVVVFLTIPAVPNAHATPLIWNESTHGQLSTAPQSPTPLTLSLGDNLIIATIGGVNRDYFKFTVQPTQSLTGFQLVSYDSMDSVAWIALQTGSAWTAGDNPQLMRFHQHFGTATTLGSNLLGISSSSPLSPDNYVVRVQQLGATTSYSLNLSVVPEPSMITMAIAGIACGGFSMWRRRKRA